MITKRLDIMAAICGLAILVGLIPVLIVGEFHPIYIVACIVGIVCVAPYFLIRNRMPVEHKNRSMLMWRLCIAGALLFSLLALLFYFTRADEYVKPLLYYICLAIGAAFLFGCALTSYNKKQAGIVLALVCMVGLMHLWTDSMMFPSLIGIDAWTHQRVTTQELAMGLGLQPNIYGVTPLGITTIGGGYSLMHLYLNKVMVIFSLNYKMAALIFWSSLQVVAGVVFIYLIGKELFDRKTGIVAALMLSMANWVIFFNEWAIPNSIGVTLSLAVAYLGIRWFKKFKWWLVVPIMAIAAISFLTHVIVSIWVVGTVACMLVVPQIFVARNSILQKVIHIAKASILPLVLCLSLVAWLQLTTLYNSLYWTVGEGTFTPASMTYALGKAPDITTENKSGTVAIGKSGTSATESKPGVTIGGEPKPPTTKDESDVVAGGQPESIVYRASNQLQGGLLGELVVNSMGMFLFMGLALTGGLMMLKGKVVPLRATWFILYCTVLTIGFLPPLLGKSLLEHRWWYLAEAFMAVPLAVVLIRLCNLSRRNYGVVIVAAIVGIVVFMSTIGLPSNITNRDLSKNQIMRYALTANEMEGLKVAGTYKPKILGTDPFYLAYVGTDGNWFYPIHQKAISIGDSILNGNFNDCPCDVIILRDALYKEPFAYGSGTIYKLEFNPVEVAKKQGYTEVWNNGEIHCLIKR